MKQSSSSTSIRTKWIFWTAIAVLIRVILFSLDLDKILQSRIELVTPITSFKRLTEGLYLVELGLSPYSGHVFLQPPLILLPFLLPQLAANTFLGSLMSIEKTEIMWARLIFIVCDLMVARGLFVLAELYTRTKRRTATATTTTTTSGNDKEEQAEAALGLNMSNLERNLPHIVAAVYLFNPIMILSCISKSTIIFTNLSLVAMLLFALKGNLELSTFFVAVAAYLTVYPVILLIPVVFLTMKQVQYFKGASSGGFVSFAKGITLFTFWAAMLFALSYTLMGRDWTFIQNAYIYPFMVRDLTPNWGNFWYFFTEVFDDFRAFFTFVFHAHIIAYVIPLALRFGRRDPLFLAFIYTGIIALFKTYPTFGDTFFYLNLALLFTELAEHTRYGFVVAIMFLFAIVLGPVFFYAWIYQGTGNANFFYFITLLYSFAQILLMIELILAKLKFNYKAKMEAAITNKKGLAPLNNTNDNDNNRTQ